MKTVIQEIACILQASKNAQQTGNSVWARRHADRLYQIQQNILPSGSGIDNGTNIRIDLSTYKRIVLDTSFHHMNDAGYYCGWTEHRIVVIPSWEGIEMKIGGVNRRDIKEYLHDIFYWNLTGPFHYTWTTEDELCSIPMADECCNI